VLSTDEVLGDRVQIADEMERLMIEVPEPTLPVCEATLMPVSDEYTYIHHNSIEVGVLKYIEKAP
jgi:hypothetical protein